MFIRPAGVATMAPGGLNVAWCNDSSWSLHNPSIKHGSSPTLDPVLRIVVDGKVAVDTPEVAADNNDFLLFVATTGMEALTQMEKATIDSYNGWKLVISVCILL
ncbi:hypothetical protein L6452_14963 [Arctium lappa]|uniref:Uncharacterized protein n=1 Tax=Arctium lappa TaxID=4217 RepID=A0ACB9CMI3_ARCLA|nr:hypothetical protein L6452_14963 [Arctium lappa]